MNNINWWVITFLGVLILGAVVTIITKTNGFAKGCFILVMLIGIAWVLKSEDVY